MLKKKKWSFKEIYNCFHQYLDNNPQRICILILFEYLKEVSFTKRINSIDQYEILNNFIYEYINFNNIIQATKLNCKLRKDKLERDESENQNESMSMNNQQIFKSLRNKHQYAKKRSINEETIKKIQEIQKMLANYISRIEKNDNEVFSKQTRENIQLIVKISNIIDYSTNCNEIEREYINFCISRISKLTPNDLPNELPLIYFLIYYIPKTPERITPSIGKLIEVNEEQYENLKNRSKIKNAYLSIASFSHNKNDDAREKAAILIEKMAKDVWSHMESKINFFGQIEYITLNFFDVDFKFLGMEINKANKKILDEVVCQMCHYYFN